MRSPMFTIVTLITIGVGVGANTAIFSVINGIVLQTPTLSRSPAVGKRMAVSARPQPARDEFSCVRITSLFAEENRTFEHFGMWNGDNVTMFEFQGPSNSQALTSPKEH